ncbi:phosphatase PAP2 family protein [Povalibacter sp.]|uniref:phosphatase PAP2 family protein n=1 Tax=Povalibacter sp. TaxID=1962978 RepID=UPI002F40C630
MELTADFLARHAIAALSAMATIMLLLTFVLWRLVERFGASLWQYASRGWDAFRASSFAQQLRRVPGLGLLLTHTLTAARYLGLYALGSFVVALGALAAFFELADDIGVDEDFARFDAALATALSRHLSTEILGATALITHLGDAAFLIGLGTLVALILLIKRRVLLALTWAIATAAGALLNRLLKSIFERVRPIHDHGVVVADGWSFPSGHAAGAMLVYGLLAYVLIRHTRRSWHLPIAIVAVALIVFVGFSRVLLQVHYLSDVLAGYLSAASWGLLCVAGLEAVRWHERQSTGPASTPSRMANRPTG